MRLEGTPLSKWMGELRRLNQDNAWRYIAMLEKLLREYPEEWPIAHLLCYRTNDVTQILNCLGFISPDIYSVL